MHRRPPESFALPVPVPAHVVLHVRAHVLPPTDGEDGDGVAQGAVALGELAQGKLAQGKWPKGTWPSGNTGF